MAPLWRSLDVRTPSFSWLDDKSFTSERHGYKEYHSLEYSGEAVHKVLSPASLLPMGPAKREISGYNKASDPASTSNLCPSPCTSLLQARIFHQTSSIPSVITMKLLLALSALLVIASTNPLEAPNPGICL